MTIHILVVDDDTKLCYALTSWLEHAGYQVFHAHDGKTAVDLLHTYPFNIVVSDIVLGGDMTGIQILQIAKQQPTKPEVIMLTGHASLETSIQALREQAFDYLTKPCPPQVLLKAIDGALQKYHKETQIRQAAQAMITAMYGQTALENVATGFELSSPSYGLGLVHQQAYQNILQVGELSIGNTRHEVTFQGQPVHVTPTEYALLRYLAERVGQTCLCQEIVQYTHGLDTNDHDAQTVLRSHIRNIRKKIDSSYLVNDRGMGYSLVDPTVPSCV